MKLFLHSTIHVFVTNSKHSAPDLVNSPDVGICEGLLIKVLCKEGQAAEHNDAKVDLKSSRILL
jgi:hypothetical protein